MPWPSCRCRAPAPDGPRHAGLLLPIHATALPLYVAFDKAALQQLHTRWSRPSPSRSSASSCSCSSSRPADDLLDAGRLDGMGEVSLLLRVVLPNAWPASPPSRSSRCVAHWNDLFWPLIVVSDNALRHAAARPSCSSARGSGRRLRRADGGDAGRHPSPRRGLPARPEALRRGIT